MNLEKSYLGFTDKKIPIQKAKIEKSLDKAVRFEGVLCTKKDFIFQLLLSGHKPKETLNNGRFDLRTYEKLDAKTEHRMQADGESCYYAITKTEYDFACYLLAQDLASEESAARFMNAEQEKLSRERLEREARERREAEEKQAALREKKEFDAWLKEQAAAYSNQERLELMKTVFTNLAGVSNPRIELLVLFENIDKAMCRDELLSWLHIGNPASRKTFECVTGLKLPKTAKGTKAFLASLSAADYKASVPFKIRQPSSKIPEETFYVRTREGFQEVMAEPLSKYGFQWFVQNIAGGYRISEARSGISAASGKNKQAALDGLKNLMERMTAEGIEKSVQDNINAYGLSPRYSETGGEKNTEGAI